MEKRYKYTGPLTGVTLSDKREIMLHPGQEVDLPEDNKYVKALVGLKRLKEIPAPVETQNLVSLPLSTTSTKSTPSTPARKYNGPTMKKEVTE